MRPAAAQRSELRVLDRKQMRNAAGRRPRRLGAKAARPWATVAGGWKAVASVLFLSLILAFSALPAAAQSDRVVALVVSVGQGAARADAIQAQLQVMGAETLRSANPNNAEMRSMLQRFAAESANARATFVYLDMPAVAFEGREFVLPASVRLGRPTDLFTQAIPLLAFARTAAQAEEGGAVVMTVSAPPDGLPDALTPVESAPEPVPGSSPILVANYSNSDPIVQVVAAVGRDEVIEIGAMFRRMQAGEGVTVSELPASPIFLRSPARPNGAAGLVAGGGFGLQPDAAAGPETLEELAILEQSLSRSAKRLLQRSLRDLGHYKGLVDGIFGPQTREAITVFQKTRSEETTGVLTRRQLLDLRALR